MKHLYKKLGIVLLFVLSISCNLDGDLQNPNDISVAGADIDLIMNSVEADFASFFSNVTSVGSQLTRLESMTGGDRYATAIRSTTTNGVWFWAYQRVLVNAETVIALSQPEDGRPDRTTHRAVAQLLSAYVYMALVDVYGDVPQTEALKGPDGNFTPAANADGGAAVYDYALSLITEAKAELAKTGAAAGPALSRDPYYAGNRARWNALANTLELKVWMNKSAKSPAAAKATIDAILATDLIDTEAENFTYKYAAVTVPGSRHPLYDQYYNPIRGSAGGYIGNYYQYELFNGYPGVQDPRWRYILYRQVGSNAQAFKQDPKNVGCGTRPEHYAPTDVWCQFEPGFYGRDHGDDSGTNPDSPFITAAGIYPAGGKLDNKPTTDRTYHEPTIRGDGANGAGIEPIWMSFYTDFMKAEHAARNNQDAKTLVATAIGNSITQIRNFATSKGFSLTAGLEPSTAAYQSAVATAYDNAAVKMNVVAREFYMSTFGNGIEAYNLYRRTGAPTNMQPARVPNPGAFYHAYVYPATYVNLNSNASQKDLDNPAAPFWDPMLTLK